MRMRTLPPLARQAQFEHPFVRLLHLLAHHPDHADGRVGVDELRQLARYVAMFLDAVAGAENAPFLYHLAGKCKTVRDAVKDEEVVDGSGEEGARDVMLWRMSELAQHLIRRIAADKGWALPTHPAATTMPSDVFRQLPDKLTGKKVRRSSSSVGL